MKKIYGIRVWQGSLVVRNGKLALYESKELAAGCFGAIVALFMILGVLMFMGTN